MIRTLILTTFFSLSIAATTLAAPYKSVEEYYGNNIGIASVPSTLNIRDAPSSGGKVIALVPDSGIVKILERGEIWSYVQSNGIKGYVMTKYLITGQEALEKANKIAIPYVRIPNSSMLYKSPNKEQQWETVKSGTTLPVLEESGNWLKVDIGSGYAWIQSHENSVFYMGLQEAQRFSQLTGERGKLVSYSLQFLGNPYVWGGNDPFTGADCSGFVKYVYKHVVNVDLPRTSYTQCYVGDKISSTQMKPGDLIFYNGSSGRVGHVAMYIGSGTIIHAASTSQGIRLGQWNYRTPSYIRRVIP